MKPSRGAKLAGVREDAELSAISSQHPLRMQYQDNGNQLRIFCDGAFFSAVPNAWYDFRESGCRKLDYTNRNRSVCFYVPQPESEAEFRAMFAAAHGKRAESLYY
jgi:hypothetical protein